MVVLTKGQIVRARRENTDEWLAGEVALASPVNDGLQSAVIQFDVMALIARDKKGGMAIGPVLPLMIDHKTNEMRNVLDDKQWDVENVENVELSES